MCGIKYVQTANDQLIHVQNNQTTANEINKWLHTNTLIVVVSRQPVFTLPFHEFHVLRASFTSPWRAHTFLHYASFSDATPHTSNQIGQCNIETGR